MLTRAERIYLSMTLAFLAAGSGIQAWRRAGVELGHVPDPATPAVDSLGGPGKGGFAAEDDAGSRTGAAGQATGAAGSPTGAAGASSGAVVVREDSTALPHFPGSPASAASAAFPAAGSSGEIPSGRGEAAAAAGKTASRIDLNRAGADELMRIPGVGAKTAQAILAYRREKGRFRDLSDLLNIKGIGRKKLEKMAPRIIL